MSRFDNLSTQIEQQRLENEFELGMEEGDAAPLTPLPAVAYKPLKDCTRRERGYIVAYILKLDEWLRGTL